MICYYCFFIFNSLFIVLYNEWWVNQYFQTLTACLKIKSRLTLQIRDIRPSIGREGDRLGLRMVVWLQDKIRVVYLFYLFLVRVHQT